MLRAGLLLFFAAAGLTAQQQPTPPVVQRAIEGIVSQYRYLPGAPLGVIAPLNLPSPNFAPPPPPKTCSVPLTPVQIPDNVHFTMQKFAPPPAKMAPMPQTTGAPPCEPR